MRIGVINIIKINITFIFYISLVQDYSYNNILY